MKVFILAAGRGSRLHPYTEECPKCLTELGGMALIERQLETLRGAGISDINIVTGYRADRLQLPGTKQIENPDWATTNMVESLFAAEKHFDDDFIVAYSDIIYEPRVIQALIKSTSDISVVVDRQWRSYWEHRFDDPLSDAESLKIDGHGHITDIGQKVEDINEIEAQYIGLMRFKGTGIAKLREAYASIFSTDREWKKNRPPEKAYMTDILMEMIHRKVKIGTVPIDSGWLEIDTVKDFETANRMFNDESISKFFIPSVI